MLLHNNNNFAVFILVHHDELITSYYKSFAKIYLMFFKYLFCEIGFFMIAGKLEIRLTL